MMDACYLKKKKKKKKSPHWCAWNLRKKQKQKNKKTIVKELTQHSLSFFYTRDASFSEEFLLHSWG